MREDKLKNNETIFLITDEKRYVNEEYIREMLYNEEVEHLVSNSKDFFKGELNLEYQLNSIWNSVNADIDEVIEILGKCWGINVVKCKKGI